MRNSHFAYLATIVFGGDDGKVKRRWLVHCHTSIYTSYDRGPWIRLVCQLGGELFHPKYGATFFARIFFSLKFSQSRAHHGGTYGSRTFEAVKFLNENSWVAGG